MVGMNEIADRPTSSEKPLTKFAFKTFSSPTELRDSWDAYEIVHEPVEGSRIATVGFRRSTKQSSDLQPREPISLQAVRESVAFAFTSEVAKSRKEIVDITEEIKRTDARWRVRGFALDEELQDGWEFVYRDWWILYCVNDELILMTFLLIPYLNPVVEFRKLSGEEINRLSEGQGRGKLA